MLALTVFEILGLKCLTLKIHVKVTKNNIRSCSIRCQISMSIKVITGIVALALTVTAIFSFQMFDLANLGQAHGVQHSYGLIRYRISNSIKVIFEHFR